MRYVPLLGRIFFSIIFIDFGLNHLIRHADMTAYAEASGVPAAGFMVILSGIMIILGGLSVLFGYKPKIGSILLFIFLVLAAFMVHHYWSVDDPMQMQDQMVHFMKNISLAGASLLIFYFGTGPLSVDGQSRPEEPAAS